MTRSKKSQSFAPRCVEGADILAQIGDLRTRAWLANGELPRFISDQAVETDEHDAHGMHWAVLRVDRPISAIRTCLHPDAASCPDSESLDGYTHLIEPPIATVARLVVDPDFRGHGRPDMLMQSSFQFASEQGCRSIVAVAERESVMRYLQRHCFVKLGPTKTRYISSMPSFLFLKRIPQVMATPYQDC
jgi:GNAT superfamily N-acetyltransferase